MTGKNESASFWKLVRTRNFGLLWGAGGLSAIGDQFDLIAFPWLIVLITGDPLAVGLVIAVGSVPTVFFMLLGGSLVDRFSPRMIMLTSNVIRIALAGSLAAIAFLISSILLLLMRIDRAENEPSGDDEEELGVFSSIGQGIRFVRADGAMWAAAGLALAIGVVNGYVDILFTSWLQGRTPRAMMGRVMSMLMVAAVGLSPISAAASGALIKQSLEWVFVASGILIAVFCIVAGLRREVREMRMAENSDSQ